MRVNAARQHESTPRVDHLRAVVARGKPRSEFGDGRAHDTNVGLASTGRGDNIAASDEDFRVGLGQTDDRTRPEHGQNCQSAQPIHRVSSRWTLANPLTRFSRLRAMFEFAP